MENKQEIIRIIKKYRDTEYLDTAADEILRLFSVVGRSEQLKAEVFTLANKLALAGEGDAAVAMHRIHKRL